MSSFESNTIDVSKTAIPIEVNNSCSKSDQLIVDMHQAIEEIFTKLKISNSYFNCDEVFVLLNSYVYKYKRILYSNVSSIIFNLKNETNTKKDSNNDSLSTVTSNLQSLFDYCNDDECISRIKAEIPESEQDSIEYTIRAVWKLWDHVNLAQRQYEDLRQTDEEYDNKFKNRISSFKTEITKEMNAQLITMVGIFTALAFILFGGISSLHNLFAGIKEANLFPAIIIGCIWGLAILNVTFVFLFSVGKMTNLSFKSTHNTKATFWQRYPVVVWTDFLLVFIMVISLWTNYCLNRKGLFWLDQLIANSSTFTSLGGYVILLTLFGVIVLFLIKKTKGIEGDEDE